MPGAGRKPISQPPSPDLPRESDRASVARYLLSFDWPARNAAVEENLVEGGLPLWLEILRLVPQTAERGRLLELGSPPFHVTLLAERMRNYEVVPTAAAADNRPRFRQRMVSRAYEEDRTFDCACFDLERDPFPFPDAWFDAVMFCEVIEHLTENPVFALREIHRVLKPGGTLVVSTPNAARSGNIMRLWLGANVFDQYHLGAPLRGTRHSREYTLSELRDLLGGCGFRIDRAVGRNLGQIQFTRRTRPLEKLFRLFTLPAPGVHRDHLFVRVTKDGPFRWCFPPEIFDQGHLVWYQHVCEAEIEMGRNDVPHTGPGWGPLVTEGDKPCRRAEREADAYLLPGESHRTLRIEARATGASGAMDAEAWQEAGGNRKRLATGHADLRLGEWFQISIALGNAVQPGVPIHVRILSPAGAYIHRIALQR